MREHLTDEVHGLQMRHVEATGSANRYKALPKFPRNAGQPWANIYNGPMHVIFGHHARRRLQVRAPGHASSAPCHLLFVYDLVPAAPLYTAEAVGSCSQGIVPEGMHSSAQLLLQDLDEDQGCRCRFSL